MTIVTQANENGQLTLFKLDLAVHLAFHDWARKSAHAMNVARYDEESHPAWIAERRAADKLEDAICAYQQASGHKWQQHVYPGDVEATSGVAPKLETYYRRWQPDGLEPLRYGQTLRCNVHDVASVVAEAA